MSKDQNPKQTPTTVSTNNPTSISTVKSDDIKGNGFPKFVGPTRPPKR